MKLFHSLYKAVVDKVAHPKADRYLYGLSFCESSFFPIPPDVMLAPMCAVTPNKALRLALWTTVFSVLGGYFGYLLGFLLVDSIEPWLSQPKEWPLSLVFQPHHWTLYQEAFDKWGEWVVFIAAFSPIPYKVFTVGAGVFQQDLIIFGIASLLGRGGRFMLVALILRWCGPKVLPHIERQIHIIGWVVTGLIVVGIIWAIQ